MGLLIRTLLIWSLVLAVSAQGAAAATMKFCGPNHHASGAAAPLQRAAAAEHAHHDGAVAAEHEHPQAEVQADKGSAGSAASAKASEASQHKCSACASCCSVGAILSSVLAVPAPVVTPTVFSAVVPRVDTFAADGPDRPPRIGLA